MFKNWESLNSSILSWTESKEGYSMQPASVIGLYKRFVAFPPKSWYLLMDFPILLCGSQAWWITLGCIWVRIVCQRVPPITDLLWEIISLLKQVGVFPSCPQNIFISELYCRRHAKWVHYLHTCLHVFLPVCVKNFFPPNLMENSERSEIFCK